MISAVIFSKDRAMQLHALLESICRHAGEIFDDVIVIWTASTDEHAESYRQLEQAGFHVEWWREAAFETDVRCAVYGSARYVCFLVDDDVFYRDLPRPIVAIPGPDEACFSLRLGGWGGGYLWRWVGVDGDGGYPFSLDGHIFERDLILPQLAFRFENPTQLEAHVAGRAEQVFEGRPLMAAWPCLVGIPANRVSSSSGCAYDGRAEWSADELCRRYLAGERIDLEAMDWSRIGGAHQIVPFAFRTLK